MNNKDRKIFWETLTSLTGQNIPEECRKLTETIKYPKKLYRFRKADTNSLEAMRTNRLFFSSAEYYDDPFDSFCSINWNTVENGILNALLNPQNLNQLALLLNIPETRLSQFFNFRSIEDWTTLGTNIIDTTRKEIQKRHRSICFTEKELNEVLWLKYADNHYGFALMYNITPEMVTRPQNAEMPFSHPNYSLYPIYYSNQTYDATDYARFVAIDSALKNYHPDFRKMIYSILPSQCWQYERVCLIKHKCHEYDKEWRILHNDLDGNGSKFITFKPSGVIIGLRTEKPTRDLIIALAREAGIPKIYECFIDNNNKLNKRIVKES